MSIDAASALRAFRKTTGLNQKEFAKHIGVNSTYYSDIENGRKNVTDKLIDQIGNKYPEAKQKLQNILTIKYTQSDLENAGVKRSKIHLKNTPSVHPNQGNNVFENFNDQWQGLLKDYIKDNHKIRTSDEYKRAERLKTQILINNADVIKTLVETLKEYWTLQIKFMTFINQFDKYLLPDITYEFYEEIKKGKDEAQIITEFNKLKNAIEELPTTIQNLSNSVTKILDKAKRYDIGNQLNRDLIKEIKQLIDNRDFELVYPLRRMIDLYEKKYTP